MHNTVVALYKALILLVNHDDTAYEGKQEGKVGHGCILTLHFIYYVHVIYYYCIYLSSVALQWWKSLIMLV